MITTTPVFAAGNTEVTTFTHNTLTTLIALASLISVVFIIKGGYTYITSTGSPDALENAKKTIRNALIGLLFVLGAGIFSSLLSHAFSTPHASTATEQISLKPIESVAPSGGLTQVLIDAVVGFLQAIIQSATKPLTDGIISFLTTAPSVVNNSVIFNFWLTMVGITDSLFALIIALLGFHFMSASSLGFEELELKQLLPRIALSFLGINMSIFLVDGVLTLCNVLVRAVLHATGGINSAWILNAFDPKTITVAGTSVITLIFMLLFVILCVVLLLFYITRLIIISLGAVLSPLIFLLWIVPKFTDFAEISMKTYIVNVFSIFVHVVIIQLASAFLTIPGQVGTNSLISILVGVALLFTLIKTPQALMQFAFYTSFNGAMRKIGGKVINVMHSQGSESQYYSPRNSKHGSFPRPSRLVARKVVKA